MESKIRNWVVVFVAALFISSFQGQEKQEESHSISCLYFTPKILEEFLQTYTAAEKELIEKDLQVVRSVCFAGIKPAARKPFYLATAGGPGARKTTILERFIAAHPEYQTGVYLDPSQRGLKFMAHTYYSQSLNAKLIAENIQYLPAVRAAYEKWQNASIYICLKLIEEAFGKNLSVVHGTTSTGDHVARFFSQLHHRGYEIKLLLCSSPDQFRYDAVKYRNTEQRFYQSTPKEAFNKGKLFTERMPVYFEMADELYLYWSGSLMEPEQLAMVFSRGMAQTLHSAAATAFIAKYEADRADLFSKGKELPAWRDLVEKYQSRFKPSPG